MMKRICINDFVTNKEDPHAFPAAVSAAVCAAADGPAELVLRPGEYHIYSRDTACGFYHISNNDPGEKSILFYLRGCKNLTIDGGGAVLTPDYARQIGADYYAKDAKQSADIAKSILG